MTNEDDRSKLVRHTTIGQIEITEETRKNANISSGVAKILQPFVCAGAAGVTAVSFGHLLYYTYRKKFNGWRFLVNCIFGASQPIV